VKERIRGLGSRTIAVALAGTVVGLGAIGGWVGACTQASPEPLLPVAQSSGLPVSGDFDDFRLIDHTGASHAMGYYSDQKSVTLVGLSHRCERASEVLDRMAALENEEQPGRRFFLAPDVAEPREVMGRMVENAGLDAKVLMDATATVAPTVGLQRAGDVVVVDLEAFTWERVQEGFAECAFEQPDGSEISYVDDVVPTLETLCLECHHDRRKFSLFSDYETVVGWSAMIQRTVRTQRMPPGGHDGYYGAVENGYTQDQIATLMSWFQAGAPRGEGLDPLPALNESIASVGLRRTWGRASRSFRMDEDHILPAAGPDQYKYAQISEPLEEDMWVRGIRMVLNTDVTHHVNLLLLDRSLEDSQDEFIRKNSSDMLRLSKLKGDHLHYEKYEKGPEEKRMLWALGLTDERVLMTYGRSKRTLNLDPGMAIRIPKGSVLVLEIHYGLTGKEETNNVRVLVYEHEGDEAPVEVKRASFYRTGFRIPPGKKHYTIRTGIALPQDITLLEVVPHMHRRGRSARYLAIAPDGTEEVLVSVPFFQYKYQPHWALAEPKPLPKGTKLVTEMIYDNSAQNPINPDPEAWVENGSQRVEEMHLPRFYYLDGLHENL
jgi:hypothetical protein